MTPKEIIVHCSATFEGQDIHAADIDRWHRQRGFQCIGYHFVINLKGDIEDGRLLSAAMGAHCTGHNSKAIGICYVGGLQYPSAEPADTRTPEQKKALLWLITALMVRYNIPISSVHCHNEFAAKACPCFSVLQLKGELAEYQKDTCAR